MNRTYVAVALALAAGIGIGVSIGSAGAQATGPVVPVGVAGTNSATVAWFFEPATKTVWACSGLSSPGQCQKAHLP